MRKHIKWIVPTVILIMVLTYVLVGIFAGWDTAKLPWDFISDQILGMKWLNELIGKIIKGISEFMKNLPGNLKFKMRYSSSYTILLKLAFCFAY